MKQERYDRRDLAFSHWHRGLDPRYKFLDVDWVEFCHSCSEPLALVEIALDVGKWKPTTVLERLARRSRLPAFCILYQVNAEDEVVGARVRRIYPNRTRFEQRDATQLERLIARIHERCCRDPRANGGAA